MIVAKDRAAVTAGTVAWWMFPCVAHEDCQVWGLTWSQCASYQHRVARHRLRLIKAENARIRRFHRQAGRVAVVLVGSMTVALVVMVAVSWAQQRW